nr:DUF5720 family protein [Dorea longicatena]
MSISIHELLAVARESEGVKAVKGDAMLCEKRFAPSTRYMVEFLLLEQSEQFGNKGEYHRCFLTKESYHELIELQNVGVLRFQRRALVLEGILHYLPRQVVRAGNKKFNRLERKNSNRNKFQTLGSSFSGDFSTEQ